MIKLKDFIVKTKLPHCYWGQPAFYVNKVQDEVYIESLEESKSKRANRRAFKKDDNQELTYQIFGSDYAILNGADIQRPLEISKYMKDRNQVVGWNRDCGHIVRKRDDIDGWYFNTPENPSNNTIGVVSAMQLNLSAIVTAKKIYPEFGKIEHFKNSQADYHTIEFGFYPQDVCDEESTLEGLNAKRMLMETGKSYLGQQVFKKNHKEGFAEYVQKTLKNPEYEYNGKKYVRVKSSYSDIGIVRDKHRQISKNEIQYANDNALKDKHKRPENGGVKWIEVKPIKWIIRNWDDMPKEINPQGTGKAKTMILRSELALNTMPYFVFAPNEKKPQAKYKELLPLFSDESIHPGRKFAGYGSARGCIWQNSLLRAYLNGYNLAEQLEKGNGMKNFGRKENFDFKDGGFLNEAFDYDLEKLYKKTNKVFKNADETDDKNALSIDDEELSL